MGMNNYSFKRARNKNWSNEEKHILRNLINQSLSVIENKSTKTYINNEKLKTWKHITEQFNKLSGKDEADVRSLTELRSAWRRMKLAHNERLKQNTQPDSKPTLFNKFDFKIDVDYDDSNDMPIDMDSKSPPYSQEINLSPSELNNQTDQNVSQSSDSSQDIPNHSGAKLNGVTDSYTSNNYVEKILSNNEKFKEKQMKMLEIEHQYNIKIAKLKIKKLELEIDLLSKKSTNSE